MKTVIPKIFLIFIGIVLSLYGTMMPFISGNTRVIGNVYNTGASKGLASMR